MEDKFLPLKRSRLLMDEDGAMHHTAQVVRLRTEKPPAHCILNVDSLSEVQDACASRCNKDHLISTEFSAGGYTWVLSVYPKGNKQEQVDDHLSVYVTLVDKLNPGSFVDVVLRFFLYDHLRDAYLSVLDVRERRFHVLKDTWGVPKFLSVSTFNDADYGFLVNDCCVFGAEVLVINNHFKISTMSIVQENCDRSYTWRIENFSTLNVGLIWCSPVYCFDGWSWKLVLYARGSNKEKGKSLSLYLQLDDTSRLTQGNKLYVTDFLCLKNQRQGKDHKESGNSWFTASAVNWGFDDFISLNDIHDSSKGYLVDDTIIIEHRIQKMILLKDVESVKQE